MRAHKCTRQKCHSLVAQVDATVLGAHPSLQQPPVLFVVHVGRLSEQPGMPPFTYRSPAAGPPPPLASQAKAAHMQAVCSMMAMAFDSNGARLAPCGSRMQPRSLQAAVAKGGNRDRIEGGVRG